MKQGQESELTIAGTRTTKGVTRAMILAAGVGSRLKPWTDTAPKALAVVNGKSLLQRNIEYLQQFDILEVVVNVHHFPEQIIAAVATNNGWGSNIIISDESEEVLETGGGLLHAATHLQGEEPFVMMNVDILTDMNLASMITYHQEKKPLATLATSDRQTSRNLLFDEGNNLCGWRNNSAGEEKVIASFNNTGKNGVAGTLQPKAFNGIHIIDPKIFSLIQHTGKFSIIDAYLELMKEHTIKSFEQSESRFIDVGKPGSIEKAGMMFT